MKAFCTVALFVFCLTLQSAKAEITAPDEFDVITPANESELPSASFRSSWNSKVAVLVSTGDMEFPYGPPGFKTYKGASKSSGLGLEIETSNCIGFTRGNCFFSLYLSNHFPSSGRQYDVQAVAWTDMGAQAGIRFNLFDIKSLSIDALGRVSADYERFQYSRGVFSFQTVPVQIGLRSTWDVRFQDNPMAVGFDVSGSQILLSQILVKYNPAPTSAKSNASMVEINNQNKVFGRDIEAGIRFGFSSLPGIERGTPLQSLQHEVSLFWTAKSRTSSNFMLEKSPLTDEQKNFDLSMKENSWALRWAERI